MLFHNFSLSRSFVVDATQVKHAMDNHTQQFRVIRLGELLRIGANGVERNHHITTDATAIAVVEGDDVGVIVVLEKFAVGVEYVLVVSKNIRQRPHPLSERSGNFFNPTRHSLMIELR